MDNFWQPARLGAAYDTRLALPKPPAADQQPDRAADGRPDPRPDVRENEPILGRLSQDFDFSQAPRPPVLLATNPPTDSPAIPAYFTGKPPCTGRTTPPRTVPRPAREETR